MLDHWLAEWSEHGMLSSVFPRPSHPSKVKRSQKMRSANIVTCSFDAVEARSAAQRNKDANTARSKKEAL